MRFTKHQPETVDARRVPTHEIGTQGIRDAIETLTKQAQTEDPIFMVDLGDVLRKQLQWTRMLPRIQPFYAVKCNGDARILEALKSCGNGFDCASEGEMEAVLGMGVSPDLIIYAHPCKPASHLLYAKKAGVKKMTFDNTAELDKVKKYYPEAELVLRVLADDSSSVCQLGKKFGTAAEDTYELLKHAKALDMNVVGVSFHVGSGCQDASAFAAAVALARTVFDEGAELGFDFTVLDVGGGFPGNDCDNPSFKSIATELTAALDTHFPVSSGIRIIAEPGRYFVSSACTLAVNVIAKRPGKKHESSKAMYYVNDGVYGSFNCTVYDHAVVTPKTLKSNDERVYDCTIWGPTCDSFDCINETAKLPALEAGDWIYYEDMGAYTICAGSTFNGFVRPTVIYTFSTSEWFCEDDIPVSYPAVPALSATKAATTLEALSLTVQVA